MSLTLAFAASLFSAGIRAQQAGTNTAETHPTLPISSCTAAECLNLGTSITLDANWRWTHTVDGSTNCYTGNEWDASICSSPSVCAASCALDGANYESTYGISTAEDSITLTFVTGANVGSRNYLLDKSGEKYQMFDLRNKEFTFDVDVSKLPCGLNGALYFVEMPADGGLSTQENNKAGAKYGTGYCDSQCPQDVKFINGEANIEDWTPSSGDPNSGTGSKGACCAEMDIWEANSISAAYTPHPCNGTGLQVCSDNTTCGAGDSRYDGICDRDGCDFNSYRMGNESFYGSDDLVDTASPFTVVTQFITDDSTDDGTLVEIKRIYIQGDNVIHNSVSNIAGVDASSSITEGFCKQQKTAFGDENSFDARGGLASMGEAFGRGMVLVMSVWDDYAANMLWLDSTYPVDSTRLGAKRGSCDAVSGVPKTVEGAHGDATVKFSAIKFGTLNSTFAAAA
ncbi:glycoside hydrolase family 7 protein [Dothistroma septosporum NZE10]|uniref:Glucanase n=1 Tax=Dothistroma septosporum (strain NZE10 / CBS 128990) TaxID=675120 RepID=N1PY93_DOTSN|nr:glycoside hydrolase family 7 protein [Dothistroma septosporum NZE10]